MTRIPTRRIPLSTARTTRISRAARNGALIAACSAVPLVALAAPVQAAPYETETGGHCASTSLTAYGHKSSCEQNSIWDRVSTTDGYRGWYAIRGDRHVMVATPNGGWAPISNGYADEVKYVDVYANGEQTICVEVRKSGNAFQATYHHVSGSWTKFSAGCDLG